MQSSHRSRHICPYCSQRQPKTLVDISVGRCQICFRMRPHSEADLDWMDLPNPYWPPPGLLWNWNERMYETKTPRIRTKGHSSKKNTTCTPGKLKLKLPCQERRREPLVISEPTLEGTTANIIADPIPAPLHILRRQRSDPSMEVSSLQDYYTELERHNSSPGRTFTMSPFMERSDMTAGTISPIGTMGTFFERPRRQGTFEDNEAISSFARATVGTDRPMSQTYVISLPLQEPSVQTGESSGNSGASRRTISDESPPLEIDEPRSPDSDYGVDLSLSAQRRRQIQRNTYLFSQAVQGLHYPLETATRRSNALPNFTSTQQEGMRRFEKRLQAINRATELERQWKTSNSGWRYG